MLSSADRNQALGASQASRSQLEPWKRRLEKFQPLAGCPEAHLHPLRIPPEAAAISCLSKHKERVHQSPIYLRLPRSCSLPLSLPPLPSHPFPSLPSRPSLPRRSLARLLSFALLSSRLSTLASSLLASLSSPLSSPPAPSLSLSLSLSVSLSVDLEMKATGVSRDSPYRDAWDLDCLFQLGKTRILRAPRCRQHRD